MTDDVKHSTQYCIKYVNTLQSYRDQCAVQTIETWQANSSTKKHTYGCKTFCSHGNSLFSSSHPLDFKCIVIFSSKMLKRPQTQANIFICLLDHLYHGCHRSGNSLGKKILQGQGKVREFHFELGKIYIFEKSQGKVKF